MPNGDNFSFSSLFDLFPRHSPVSLSFPPPNSLYPSLSFSLSSLPLLFFSLFLSLSFSFPFPLSFSPTSFPLFPLLILCYTQSFIFLQMFFIPLSLQMIILHFYFFCILSYYFISRSWPHFPFPL
uniref:Uncharacterized protein n=1 Tax=Cacopsylla melanoneura TaxID=428564 RepID=A0A8D8T7K5_9HEMI